ncbi:Saccharopine dehydrogenase [NADP(+), L-glutamate-forming] [Bifiguratus adelaidae]|uniref:Saccharopine dehydrogenase [NADP(+), L-glutamate-forming] n=1 Tax=Bifiguratus adelaidae TaxID=1938954 RepID=A0A261Y0X5_9FUNG|nr:Saccharopine dehydrogenase [NADP(+), L-glutamate-forming] [Bifiguratus adelaidae]
MLHRSGGSNLRSSLGSLLLLSLLFYLYTMGKNILLLGSGFVAGPCVEYLLRRPDFDVTIASRTLSRAQALQKQYPRASATSVDINDTAAVEQLVSQFDLVISLIPYTYHAEVIKAAIKYKKHVVTTSYINPQMAELDQAAKDAGITVMNEIGLDPGIDHLYAIKTIDEVHKAGGKLTSFLSYCGGLPAPECSNNPFGYKFSWSARGVLLALRNTARFIEGGKVVEVPGPELMNSAKPIFTGYPGYAFVGYANRDSTPYAERYQIPEAHDILRGTLRYVGFPEFVKALVDIGFLNDQPQAHLDPAQTQPLPWSAVTARALSVNSSQVSAGSLQEAVISKANLSKSPAKNAILEGMRWLGLFSDKPCHPRGNYLDTLCATLEELMQYGEGERDLVFLQHRFEITHANGQQETRTSTLVEYGVPNGVTAMAKTVGVPCGIATTLVLDGKLAQKGVLAPMTRDICDPIMELLEKEGIGMVEATL